MKHRIHKSESKLGLLNVYGNTWRARSVLVVLVALSMLLALVSTVRAATIGLDATSSSSTTDSSSLSWSHTIGSQSNRVLIVGYTGRDYDTGYLPINSVTYNGIALTKITSADNAWDGSFRTELWYLSGASLPSAGTYTVTINASGAVTSFHGWAMSLYNVAQQAPEAIFSNAASTTAPATITSNITTLTDGAWVVDAFLHEVDGTNLYPDTCGNSEWHDVAVSSGSGWEGHRSASSTKTVATAGSTCMDWHIDIDGNWAHIGAAFAPATDLCAFNYLSTPVDVSPTTAGSWVDVDVSSYVPSGATGVIVQVVATAIDRRYGIRAKGSGDTWMSANDTAKGGTTTFLMAGLDANRVFQVATEDTAVKTYLIGYTGPGVTFFTDAPDKSLGTTGSFQNVDISADTGADTAIGAIFTVTDTGGSGYAYALRKNGSTDDIYQEIRADVSTIHLVGVDASEIAQMKIGNTAIDLHLTGYITSGAVFFTNAKPKATGTTGSYVDVDISADIGSDDANGAILEIADVNNNNRSFAVRRKGAVYDYYADTRHNGAITAVDDNYVFQQKIESTDQDLYLLGYTQACSGSPSNSAPNTPNIDNYNTGAYTTDSTPTLQFDLSDPDSGDIVKYQVQIDNNSDFSSPEVNTTEASGSAEPRNNVTFTPAALADGAYYWRVKAIDDDAAESSWATANGGSVAFMVDTTPPTAPGNLTLNAKASDSITLNFGAQTTETNFDTYKIFYKQGAGGVTESDTEHTDADLGYIDYNGTSTTTLSGLSAGTQYVINIWAYDLAGNKAAATELAVTTDGCYAYRKPVTIDHTKVGASCTSTTATFQVPSNERDAWDDNTNGNITGCAFGDSDWNDAGGYQWAVTIPQGATILSAKIRVYSTVHQGALNPYTARIRVEDVDSAAAFNGASGDIYGRSYWATTVDWNINPALNTGTWSDSPDITNLLQHIVNRPGWSSGNFLGIAIWGQTGAGGCNEVINDWSANPALAAQLEVTYQAGSGNLQDFPVLINIAGDNDLRTTGNGGHVENANGYDIIFKDAGGSQLDHEVEKYDPATGQLVAWVRIPTLSDTTDTVIDMYYGNSAISTSQENAAGVWDSNHIIVQHMDGASYTALDDSTSNNNDVTAQTGDPTFNATGKIGDGVDFDGNDYVSMADSASLSSPTNAMTIQFWAKPNQNYGDEATTWFGGVGKLYDWQLAWQGWTDGWTMDIDDSGNNRKVLDLWNSYLTSGTWYHLVGVYDGTFLRIYINGSEADNSNEGAFTIGDTDGIFAIANVDDAVNSFNGIMDEVRVSSTARSACWIETEYNNQNSPSTFYSISAEESGDCPGGNSAPTAPTIPYSNDNSAQSGQTNPTGLTDPTPAFSAIYNDPDSGDIANKYRVEVNTASDFSGTVMWDSGSSGTSMSNTTEGNRSPDIIYAGSTLSDNTTYYWRIRFWDDDGTEGTVSAAQQFTTGTISSTNLTQAHTRWRNDDGGETGSTISETGNATNIGNSNTVSITHGLTINAGDVILALVHANTSGNIITDSNGAYAFTQSIQEDNGSETSRYAIFYRVAGASEPASYSWSLNSSAQWSIQIRVFSGVDNSSVWDVAPSTSTRSYAASGTTATAPSMTTSSAGAMGILAVFSDSLITFSNPTNGYGTEVEPASSRSQASYIRTWPTAGATGTASAALSASNDWLAHQVALKPATAAATWAAAEDTKLTGLAKNTIKRVRLEVSNEGASGSGPITYQLQVAETDTCGSGTYTTVSTGTSGHWQVVDSTYITDGEATANVDPGLTDEAATFVSGELKDAGNTTGSITLNSDEFTEIEFAVQATANATDGGDYCFRLYDATNNRVLDTYTAYAQVQLESDCYAYRKPVTIDHTKVGASCSSDLTDFPVLINIAGDNDLRTTGNGGHVENANGYDIIFKDAGGSQLDHEVEKYDPATGQLVAWVRIPSLSPTADTTIYLYYGNSTISASQENASGVWSSNFTMVYHFKEPSGTTGSGSVTDSTGHTSGTPSAGISFGQSGQIGDTADFSAGTGIGCGTLGPGLLTADSTISFWIYSNNVATPSRQNPFNHSYGGWGTWTVEPDGAMSWYFGSNGGNGSPYTDHYSGGGYISAGAWIYAVGVRNSNGYTFNFYKNGSIFQSGTYDSSYPNIQNQIFTIGDGYVNPLNGKIDEFRVASTPRSACWIETEYNNQNSPATFYTVGTEQNGDCAGLTQARIRWRNDGGGSDFKIQHGYTTIAAGSTTRTLTAGIDYTAPASASRAFVRIVSTRLSAAGNTTGGGSQPPNNAMAWIDDTNSITSSIVFERAATTGDTRITYEIIEYVGPAGGVNEMVVREAKQISTTSATATTSAISGISDDNAVAVFITGQGTDGSNNGNMDCGLFTSKWISATDQARFTRGDGADTGYVSYAVVEFTGSNWRNVQRVEHSYAAAATWEYENLPSSLLDMNKAFIHVQTRSITGNLDEQSGEVYLASTTQLGFYLQSGASLNPTNVVWVIENTQSGAEAMRVARYNGTRSAGTEPYYENLTITPVDSMATTSIWGESTRSSGTGTAVPRGNLGLELTATDTVQLFASDNGQTQYYRYEIVQWPSSAATWAAEDDVKLIGLAKLTPKRARFLVSNEGAASSGPVTYQLQVAEIPVGTNDCSVGTYTAVSTDASGHWQILDSNGITDGEATTNLDPGLTDPSGETFVAGELKDAGNTTGAVTLQPGEFTEIEFAVQATANATDAGEYCFRLTDDGNPLNSYEIYAQVNLLGATAVRLASFSARGDGDSVSVNWETAQEIDNLGFYLYRADSPTGDFGRLNGKLIPGATFSGPGRKYHFVDTGVTRGRLYYYRLVDVDIHGQRTPHGPICVDWDADGLPDDWEIAHGLDPTVDDAGLDADGDGLSNLAEYQRGTDPQNPDTDGDGILDGDEYFDPAAADGGARSLGRGVFVLAADETGLTLELRTGGFNAESVTVNGQEFERVRIPDYVHGSTDTVGQPQLPLKGVLVDLAAPTAGRLTVLDTDSKTYDGYRVYPVPAKSAAGPGDASRVEETFSLDEAAYETDAFYPDKVARLGEQVRFRDQPKQQVIFYPLAFNPATGQLKLYTRIRVRLDFEGQELASAAGPSPQPWRVPAPETVSSPAAALGLLGLLAPAANITPLPAALGAVSLLTGAFWTPPGDLAQTPAYKITVTGAGLYQLDRDFLASAGLDPAAVDLDQVRIYNLGQQVAIRVHDENGNGRLDAPDDIEFYARPVAAIYRKYSRANVYWLTWAAPPEPAQRMAVVDVTPSGAPPPATFEATVHYEEDQAYWQQAPGGDEEDRWFFGTVAMGDQIDDPQAGLPVSFTLNLPAVGGSGAGVLKLRLVGGYDTVHQVNIAVNGVDQGDFSWSGIAAHTVTINAVAFASGANTVNITCQSGLDAIVVDWFEATYPRLFTAADDQLEFSAIPSGQFQVDGFSSADLALYDITTAGDVKRLVNFQVTGTGPYSLDFQPPADTGSHTYLALGSSAAKTPAALVEDAPANLADASNGADYILITGKDIGWDGSGSRRGWLDDLVALRQGQGLRVKVADVTDIYDAFSYGIQTPAAIRDFLAYAYTSWSPPAPRFVLLVGDSTYDYKDNWAMGITNPVPAYLVYTDYMGETVTDEWYACISGDDAVPDLYIGRLPAADATDAAAMTAKILAYENAANTKTWEKNTLLAADNWEKDYEGIFQDMAEATAGMVPDAMHPPFKGYLQEYQDQGFSAQDLNFDLTAGINTGALIVNYSGHGSLQTWADEDIFDIDDVTALTNSGKYPFFVSMSCLTGYFAYPEAWTALFGEDVESLAELLVRVPERGASAALMPTGISTPEAQQVLDTALFDTIFNQDVRQLGPAIATAKQTLLANGNSYVDQVSQTFLLFGDPAMTLKVPVPHRPAGVDAVLDDLTTVHLSWQAAVDCNGNPVAGYNIYRSTDPDGPFFKLNIQPVTATEYMVDGASGSQASYYYAVTAVDADGDESVRSQTISARSLGAAGAGADSSGSSGGGGGGGGGCFISAAGSIDPQVAILFVIPAAFFLIVGRVITRRRNNFKL